jgi:hypothetical protein
LFRFKLNIFIFLAINSATGQPDYSQQWIEYYRSVGQNELADQIAQQMKEVQIPFSHQQNKKTFFLFQSSSTASTASATQAAAINPWAAYAQQWANAAASSNPTNGNTKVSKYKVKLFFYLFFKYHLKQTIFF